MPEAASSTPQSTPQSAQTGSGATNTPTGGSQQPPARSGAPAPAQRDPVAAQMSAQAKGTPSPSAATPAADGSTASPTGQNTVRDPVTGRWTKPPQDPAAQAAADDAAAKEAARKFRVKVDGQELELDEEAARVELEMGLGAKKRFTELDKQRREFESHLQQSQQDPAGLLQYLGIDPEAFAVHYLNNVVQQGAMTPEQRAFAEREQEVARREMALQQQEQQRQRQQWEAEQARRLDILREHAPQQLANVGLPADTGLALLIPHLKDAEAAGLDPADPNVIARAAYFARQEMDAGVVRVLQGLTGEQLVQTLGPRVLTELRRYDLQQARERKGQPAQQPQQHSAPAPTEKRVMLTEAQWRERQKAKP